MRFPSKITRFEDSILAKFPTVLTVLAEGDMTPPALFQAVRHTIEDISEFVIILDCLYALDKLEFNAETGLLHFVG